MVKVGGGGGRFTNMAVPRFDVGGCWQQHLQIVQAIVKSNGWSEGTAALQLFAHLDGEALNVALLMLEEEREKWGACQTVFRSTTTLQGD